MVKTRGPNSLPCDFDLLNLCDSRDENRGALKALLGLKQALSMAGEHNSSNKVAAYINWARTGNRPEWFTSDVL